MNEIEEFLKEEEKEMERKRETATINSLPISDRYLSIGGEPVWKWQPTFHVTEQQFLKLKIFLSMEGIEYE